MVGMAGFHVHVYFTDQTRESALRVGEGLARACGIDPKRLRVSDGPNGPHFETQILLALDAGEVGSVMDYLMVHRGSHPVLLHRQSEESVLDHTERALWLGEPQPLDVPFLERVELQRSGKGP